MKPDIETSKKFKLDAEASGLYLYEEYIGAYKHVIQKYITEKSFNDLLVFKQLMDEKYDIICTVWGGEILYLEAQFCPI